MSKMKIIRKIRYKSTGGKMITFCADCVTKRNSLLPIGDCCFNKLRKNKNNSKFDRMLEILDYIERMVKQFRGPQCYFMALMLSTEFDGEIWYDHNHCITKIGDRFYDKSGEFDRDLVKELGFLPLSDYGPEQKEALRDAMVEYDEELD